MFTVVTGYQLYPYKKEKCLWDYLQFHHEMFILNVFRRKYN